MKKIFALLIAMTMALLMLMPAFAEDSHSVKSDDVWIEVDATAKYLIGDRTDFTVDDAVDLYYLAQNFPEAITEEILENFKNNVKQNLADNSNKLVPSFGENMTTYAAVVWLLDSNGEDVENFNGVNILDLFKNSDLSTITNPYHYTVVIPVANQWDDQAAIQLADKYIADYYTEGQGMNYYGYSCDNTAMFITAIASTYSDKYEDILKDAMTVLDTYKVDGGYCYDPAYGTEPNADSTGLALMAMSSYYYVYPLDKEEIQEDEIEELIGVYNDLLTFKGPTEGSYTYGGSESAYAAFDAYKGLNEFYDILYMHEIQQEFKNLPDDSEDENTDNENAADDANANDDENTADYTTDDNTIPTTGNNDKSVFPNTGDMSSVVVLGLASLATLGLVVTKKKKED